MSEWDDYDYKKCAHCHLFVEENSAWRPGLARYVHLSRGDAADEALDASHEPKPGVTRKLAWWKKNGPAAMRARFVN